MSSFDERYKANLADMPTEIIARALEIIAAYIYDKEDITRSTLHEAAERLWKLESELDEFINAAEACRWHNLKKDPNDLPPRYKPVLLFAEADDEYAVAGRDHNDNWQGYTPNEGFVWTHWRHLDTPEEAQ